ncbi:DUF1707 SHOCT-like domain-containing protein [Streptosporangium sp. KLBMP 9127]|nr:DUF1707 domain-containing protein [Streptosporangium sp. KLBMP 9127]
MTSRDDLRIGDAEREEMMGALREHFAQGRITHEELEERLGLTLTARTGRELARVAEDLPDPRPVAPRHEPFRPARAYDRPHWHGHRARGRRHGPPVAPVLFLLGLVMFVGGFGPLPFIFLAWLIFATVGMARHRHHRAHRM